MFEIENAQFGQDQFKAFVDKINKEVEEKMPILEEVIKDQKRLNFLNDIGNGWWWTVERSDPRGFVRVRNTTDAGSTGFKDVRQAIDWAMKERGM